MKIEQMRTFIEDALRNAFGAESDVSLEDNWEQWDEPRMVQFKIVDPVGPLFEFSHWVIDDVQMKYGEPKKALRAAVIEAVSDEKTPFSDVMEHITKGRWSEAKEILDECGEVPIGGYQRNDDEEEEVHQKQKEEQVEEAAEPAESFHKQGEQVMSQESELVGAIKDGLARGGVDELSNVFVELFERVAKRFGDEEAAKRFLRSPFGKEMTKAAMAGIVFYISGAFDEEIPKAELFRKMSTLQVSNSAQNIGQPFMAEMRRMGQELLEEFEEGEMDAEQVMNAVNRLGIEEDVDEEVILKNSEKVESINKYTSNC